MNVRRRVRIVAGVMLAATVVGVTAQQVPKQGVAKQKGSLNTARAEQPKKHQEAVAAPLANQPSIALPDDKTKKNSEEIETQRKLVEFTKWLAVVGALQFLALIVQAVVFWRTLRQMRDTAKRELRAYVCVSEARVKFYSPADPEALVHVKNCGKTPAYKVRYKIHLWIGQYPLPSGTVLPPPSEVVMSATAVIGSDRGLILTHRKDPTVVIPSLPLGSAASTIYVYGTVSYEDAFGVERYTNFRLFWGPGGRTFTENGEQFGVPLTDPKGNEAD